MYTHKHVHMYVYMGIYISACVCVHMPCDDLCTTATLRSHTSRIISQNKPTSGTQEFGSSSVALQGTLARSRTGSVAAGHELVPIWNAGVAGGLAL